MGDHRYDERKALEKSLSPSKPSLEELVKHHASREIKIIKLREKKDLYKLKYQHVLEENKNMKKEMRRLVRYLETIKHPLPPQFYPQPSIKDISLLHGMDPKDNHHNFKNEAANRVSKSHSSLPYLYPKHEAPPPVSMSPLKLKRDTIGQKLPALEERQFENSKANVSAKVARPSRSIDLSRVEQSKPVDDSFACHLEQKWLHKEGSLNRSFKIFDPSKFGERNSDPSQLPKRAKDALPVSHMNKV